MAEVKDRVISINVEQTIYTALEAVLAKNGGSRASYVRNVLIEHLKSEGVLTDAMILQMVK